MKRRSLKNTPPPPKGYTPPSMIVTNNISTGDNIQPIQQRIVENNQNVKKAKQDKAIKNYLDRRGYISEDKDKRSYKQREYEDKVQNLIDNTVYQQASPGQVDFNTVEQGVAGGLETTPLGLGLIKAPVQTISGILGNKYVDYLVKNASKGNYNSWGEFLTKGRNDILTTAAEFTNPGFLGGVVGGPIYYNYGKNFIRNIQPKYAKQIQDKVFADMDLRAGRLIYDVDGKTHPYGVFANNFYNDNVSSIKPLPYDILRGIYDNVRIKPALPFPLKDWRGKAGVNSGNKIEIRLNQYLKNPKQFDGLVGHEVRHSVQSLLNENNALSVYSPETQYKVRNPKNKLYNTLRPLSDNNRESWIQSPSEVDAEVINWKIQNSIPLSTDLHNLNVDDFYKLTDFVSNRFKLSNKDANRILNAMSTNGYFKNGGFISKRSLKQNGNKLYLKPF